MYSFKLEMGGEGTLVKMDRIFQELMSIRHRLEDLEGRLSNWHPQPLHISDSKLFSLPDHLRRTYIIVASQGECNAIQVSGQTGRSRAVESDYLNQLVRMGWLAKRRNSRTLRFRPASEFKPSTHIL